LKCTPFEVLYGYNPPLISELLIPGPRFLAAETADDTKTESKSGSSIGKNEEV
jgi:hypothetical protein